MRSRQPSELKVTCRCSARKFEVWLSWSNSSIESYASMDSVAEIKDFEPWGHFTCSGWPDPPRSTGGVGPTSHSAESSQAPCVRYFVRMCVMCTFDKSDHSARVVRWVTRRVGYALSFVQ